MSTAHTHAQPAAIVPAMPPGGGSYLVQGDGTLLRLAGTDPAPAAAATDPVAPAAPDTDAL